MKKLAALLTATMMINLLATSNFGLSAGAFDTEQTNEYEVTEDVTIVDVNEEIADEPMTIADYGVSTTSAWVQPTVADLPVSVYNDNPFIDPAIIEASKLATGGDRYVGQSISWINPSVGGIGYDDIYYESWTCTCGFVQEGNVTHICDHILSGNPSSAGGYGYWYYKVDDHVSFGDNGSANISTTNCVYGPQIHSGLNLSTGTILSPYLVAVEYQNRFPAVTSGEWGCNRTYAGENEMVVDPVSVPYITYNGVRYYYYDQDGLVAPGNKANGWIQMYVGGDNIYEVKFNTNNDTNDIFAKTVAGDGLTVSAFENPTKTGQIFAGWYFDEECTQLYDFDMVITADTVLYASFADPNYADIFDNGDLVTNVEIAVGRDVIQLDSNGNVVKTTSIVDENTNVDLAKVVVDDLHYVSGWETYSDNGNVYVTPVISEKPSFTIKDAGGNVLEKVVIEPGTSLDITQYSYESEVVKSGAITSDGQSFQLVSAEKIDGLVFVEWEYVTDDDGNIDVYPIYKEAILVEIYDQNGELIDTVETVVGGNVLLTNPAVDDEKIDEIDNSGSYKTPQGDDLDDLIFSHYEVGTDDKYNVTLTGVYVPAGTLVLYEVDENGEFVDAGVSKKLPIGDEYYQVDSEGNVVGTGIIGSGENALELVPADELSGYIHVGWEFETDENGATVIKPTYVKQTSNSGPITVTTPSTSGTSGGSSSSNGTSGETSGETNENDSKNPSYGDFDDENGDDFDPFNDVETSETSGDADFGNDDDDMVNDGVESDENPDENDGNPSDENSADNSDENSNSVKPENYEETYGVAGGTEDDNDRESSGTIVPKTSDTATFGAWIAMMFTAMFGVVLVNRKKQI